METARAESIQAVLEATPTLVIFGSQSAEQAPKGAEELLQSLAANFGGSWEVRWDLRANRPHLIQGSGIPLIPGKGNQLTHESLGLDPT